jgi:hypothetical protein
MFLFWGTFGAINLKVSRDNNKDKKKFPKEPHNLIWFQIFVKNIYKQ